MSRTVHGVEPCAAICDPTPTGYYARPARPALPRVSAIPWVTLLWSTGLVLGLALLVAAGPRDGRPVALAAPSALEVEDQVRELAARVRHLEAEVAELRAPRVAVLGAD